MNVTQVRKTSLLGYTNRDIERRRLLSTRERFLAQTQDHKVFGYDYFDNPSGIGYGGYFYDGRYKNDAEAIADFFQLDPAAKILEVGCAKGFVLAEFFKLGFDVTGIDLSRYCVDNCFPDLHGKIHCGRAVDFDFPEDHFDLIICKEMLPHVDEEEALETVARIERWAKQSLIVIQCISSQKIAEKFFFWDATHKLALTEDQWNDLLHQAGYSGYCNFKAIL